MKIGELARRTGLTASTIRFYESKGLLNAVDRQSNGYREYPTEAVAVLSIIINAQQTGFTLDEIKQVLPVDFSTWRHEDLVAALRKKIGDIEAMEVRLAQNKANLITLMQLIDAKPEGMECKDNALRVMDTMGITVGKKAA
ncbi:MerR family transcriptional regulator [Aquabacterium soli]|uniref:MerR family transcriptional regulator n=1 Tax=Aquabacterium soli TaxID=2493092 RepID=A0A3R8T3T9_9BURK|nr:MerR family transcriptional regulator [Aquabacterium soli]RRS05515.1 MerR family transcriptional regulator [Aquabacterium soli]